MPLLEEIRDGLHRANDEHLVAQAVEVDEVAWSAPAVTSAAFLPRPCQRNSPYCSLHLENAGMSPWAGIARIFPIRGFEGGPGA